MLFDLVDLRRLLTIFNVGERESRSSKDVSRPKVNEVHGWLFIENLSNDADVDFKVSRLVYNYTVLRMSLLYEFSLSWTGPASLNHIRRGRNRLGMVLL